MNESLPGEVRLQLVNFLCVFAWADLDVGRRERAHIRDVCRLLELTPEERRTVDGWLDAPPETDHLSDPQEVPRRYRELFVDECARLVAVDERLDIEEAEAMRMLRELLLPHQIRDEDEGDSTQRDASSA